VLKVKYRRGFVTNSSSSSFIVNIEDLIPEQIRIIKNPREEAERLGLCEFDYPDSWWIKTDGKRIIGWTYMDNFDWIGFLELIGVPMHKVKIGPGGYGTFGLELLEREGIDVNTLRDFMDE